MNLITIKLYYCISCKCGKYPNRKAEIVRLEKMEAVRDCMRKFKAGV